MTKAVRPKRRRGRPADGLQMAWDYTASVVWHIRQGMPRPQAVKAAATEHLVTPGHVYACMNKIREAGIHEDDFVFRPLIDRSIAAVPIDPNAVEILDD